MFADGNCAVGDDADDGGEAGGVPKRIGGAGRTRRPLEMTLTHRKN
jgi:hypothetical protein